MSYHLPVNDEHLPKSFKHRIIHSKPQEVILRASIQKEPDIKEWISEFGRNSRTQWNLRTSKRGSYVICMKKFVCHHSSFQKIDRKENKRGGSKNDECNASITISIKAYSERMRKRGDKFMEAGLWANVRIGTIHTHTLCTTQTLRFLQDRNGHLRDTFFKYFSNNMVTSEARKYHESLLLDDGATEIDLADGSRNPTEVTVSYWFKQWRIMNSSSTLEENALKRSANVSRKGTRYVNADSPIGANEDSIHTIESDASSCPDNFLHASSSSCEMAELTSNTEQASLEPICEGFLLEETSVGSSDIEEVALQSVSSDTQSANGSEKGDTEPSQRDILIQSFTRKICSFNFDKDVQIALGKFVTRVENIQSKDQLLNFLDS